MTIPAAKVCGAEKGENTMTRDELEKRNVGENLDAIMCLDPRGYGVCRILYAGSRAYTGEPTAMHAAEALCKAIHPGDPVYILVGFVLLPHKVPEMDGSVSAILLARSLVLAFGAKPIIVCPQDSVEAFKKCGNVVGLHVYEDLDTAMELPLSLGVVAFTKDKAKAPAQAKALADKILPAAVISVEACGGNAKGECQDGCCGGILAASSTDNIITATCSDWGCYALMAALAYLKKDMDILHREEMESEVMRVLSRNGMIDMTGSLLPGVDGFDTRMNVGIVSMMRQCTAYAVRYSHNSDHWFGPVLAKKFFEQA